MISRNLKIASLPILLIQSVHFGKGKTQPVFGVLLAAAIFKTLIFCINAIISIISAYFFWLFNQLWKQASNQQHTPAGTLVGIFEYNTEWLEEVHPV